MSRDTTTLQQQSHLPAINLIDPHEYDFAVEKLRSFFKKKGFFEVPVQHRLSILAACEDPFTVAHFNYAGNVWPLPQTGQMWLEYELLTKPYEKGFFCVSTSYRQEPDPVPGRHDLIFPMFEFETHGDIAVLAALEKEMLDSFGFGSKNGHPEIRYEDMAKHYGVSELTPEHETKMQNDFAKAILLTRFPEHTSPFWNMKRDGIFSHKIDVILYGMETVGSAERSTDAGEMRDRFHAISGGGYAKLLYSKFGKDRVEKELEDFLALPFFARCGGGIGITRFIRALKLAGIMPDFSQK